MIRNRNPLIAALAGILALLVLYGCAQRADGSYDVNAGTIIESFRTGKLVVNEDTSASPSAWPAKPGEGRILLSGTFTFADPYDCRTGKTAEEAGPSVRGLTIGDDAEGGNRFAAEVSKETGEVLNVRLSYAGYAGAATEESGNLDQRLNGSFGRIAGDSYALSVSGPHERISPGFGQTEPERLGPIGAVIMGKGDILKGADGSVFRGRLYLGVDSIPSKEPSKRDCDSFVTFGTATFRVIR